MRHLLAGALSAAVLGLVACPGRDTPPPEPPFVAPADGGAWDDAEADNTPCAKACAALRLVECRTGFSVDGGQSCTKVCQHVQETRLVVLDLQCAIDATDLAAAKKCRGWGC